MKNKFITLLGGLCLALLTSRQAIAVDWSKTSWHGEQALSSINESGWRATVSVARGRLVHFGPDETGRNLLFAPEVAEGWFWGGHRVWLGPQSTWDKGWPPPDAWEAAAAVEVRHENGGIVLVMPESPGEWGDLVRSYRWDGDTLLCGVSFTGAKRDAQIIQILQLDPAVEIDARATVSDDVSDDVPRGYVILPIVDRSDLHTRFDPPPHVTRDGEGLRIRHPGVGGEARISAPGAACPPRRNDYRARPSLARRTDGLGSRPRFPHSGVSRRQ